MNEAVAVGTRHLIVDLRDYKARTLGRGQRRVHAHAEATEAVRIWRREFKQGDVNRHGAGLKQSFNLAEIDRSVVGPSFVNGLAHITANKHCVVPEVSRHVWRYIWGCSHGHHVHDFYVVDKRSAAYQRL